LKQYTGNLIANDTAFMLSAAKKCFPLTILISGFLPSNRQIDNGTFQAVAAPEQSAESVSFQRHRAVFPPT
jgi:hypothetical protein